MIKDGFFNSLMMSCITHQIIIRKLTIVYILADKYNKTIQEQIFEFHKTYDSFQILKIKYS